MQLPSLSESTGLRFAAFTLLYVAQGLPYGVFIVAIPAWLASKGASVGDVASFIAFVSLPWSFKLLVAPLIDRLRMPSLGLRRPWVILAQAGILATWLLTAGTADNEALDTLRWLGFLLNTCAATQDVAVDGMAIDLLPMQQRARANALMFSGQTAGIGAASWGGSRVLNQYDLSAAAWLMAAATLLILLVPLLFRERPGERLLPWTRGNAHPVPEHQTAPAGNLEMLTTLMRALLMPACLIILLTQFAERIGGGMANASWANFGHDVLGWGPETYPGWATVATVAAAIVPPLIAPLIDRVGLWRTYAAMAVIKIAMYGAIAALPALWLLSGVVPGVIIAAQLIATIASVAAVSLCMSGCRPAVAATQFAICMASFNLAQSVGGWATAGISNSGLGYETVFFGCVALNLVVLAISMVGDRRRWQLSPVAAPVMSAVMPVGAAD